jgi:methylphosphotriester-DNA--protein-cysteine methyltransferase
MMQQREADFRQRMVNQGLQEGTEAYDKAFANFSRERNDAYGSARNQALA